MLKTRLLHPEILAALARSGHGARILIADGNYPVTTESPALADKVYLNLRPGMVTVLEVLAVLRDVVPIEAAILAEPVDGHIVPFHETLRQALPADIAVTSKKRFEFYGEAKSTATTLVIATGEQRRFANVLLTIGVVTAPQDLN